METSALEDSVTVDIKPDPRPAPANASARMPMSTVLSIVVGLVGVAALASSAWVFTQTQRDINRLSTDIAQFRLSLELFGRQLGTPSGTDEASLQDLSNRIAILEDNWRNAPPSAATAALPAPAAAPATASPNTNPGDCLPTGTRFLVTAGDRYPICGVAGSVEIGSVDNGFISLADGTVIASGGNIGLPGTACMIGVVSAGEDAMTGYAEIKVTC